MKKDIHIFVGNCESCQMNKGEIVKTLRPFHPLPILTITWIEISMDFIVGPQKGGNKLTIMVVNHFLAKFTHLCSLQHPFTP
jgi:hypothetical protein